MSTPRCRCGRPSPDAFLCIQCTNDLATDIAQLANFLPELTVLLTRQVNTHRGGRARRPAAAQTTAAPAAPPAATRKLSLSEQIGLVATPLVYDPAASALLAEARNTISTWCRHLCETRRIPIERILEPA